MLRFLKWFAGIGLVLLTGTATLGALSYPSIAAAACPGCYGFEPIAERVYVGEDMGTAERVRFHSDLKAARDTVARVLEPTAARPFLFACSTNSCDARIGGHGDKGARAETHTTPFFTVVRFGPRGIDRTILTHELAHVTLHEIVGAHAVMDGRFPAWLNEGIAVIVSDDSRYLRPGDSAQERCIGPADEPLPESPFDWGPMAGRDPTSYARAACAALHWLEVHGGIPGLLGRLRQSAVSGEPVIGVEVQVPASRESLDS